MANLQKIVLFFSTLAMLLYIAIQVGIMIMLLATAILTALALAVFIAWALRPAPTHRNKLQSFNLTFESKRIEFAPTESGLYQIHLCTKRVDEAKIKKEEVEMLRREGNSITYSWQKMPMTLKREYFAKEISVELCDKLLTEKQAIKLYLKLLQNAKKQSVCNAIYISSLIETIGNPIFFTPQRLDTIQEIKSNVIEKVSFLTPLPFSSKPKKEITKNNLLIVFTFFIISDLDLEAMNVIKENSLEGYLYLLALVLIILKVITKYRDYIENDCVQ